MATQTAPALTVVTPLPTPGQMTLDQIKRIITAPGTLDDLIENLQAEEDKAEDDFYKSLASDLANAPLSLSAIDKYQAFQVKKKALIAKKEAAKELKPFLERLIHELEETQPDMLKAAICDELARLQGEAEVEKEKEELIKDQIKNLTKLLGKLEKPASAAAVKSKKR